MKGRLSPIGEHTPNQHGSLAWARAVNRYGGHEIAGRIPLKYGSAHEGATILRQELRSPQFQLRERCTIHPAFQKPVQRTLALIA